MGPAHVTPGHPGDVVEGVVLRHAQLGLHALRCFVKLVHQAPLTGLGFGVQCVGRVAVGVNPWVAALLHPLAAVCVVGMIPDYSSWRAHEVGPLCVATCAVCDLGPDEIVTVAVAGCNFLRGRHPEDCLCVLGVVHEAAVAQLDRVVYEICANGSPIILHRVITHVVVCWGGVPRLKCKRVLDDRPLGAHQVAHRVCRPLELVTVAANQEVTKCVFFAAQGHPQVSLGTASVINDTSVARHDRVGIVTDGCPVVFQTRVGR